MEVISSWYVTRANEIEEFSGQVRRDCIKKWMNERPVMMMHIQYRWLVGQQTYLHRPDITTSLFSLTWSYNAIQCQYIIYSMGKHAVWLPLNLPTLVPTLSVWKLLYPFSTQWIGNKNHIKRVSCTCIHNYVHTYVRTYIHAYIYIHMHTHIHTVYIHAYIRTCIHIHTYAYTHTYCVHTCIHTYIHAYIHTCTHEIMCPCPIILLAGGLCSGVNRVSKGEKSWCKH